MTWRPTTAQLETIAELGNARMPVTRIAEALGVTPEVFTLWAARLARGRAYEEPEPPPMPITPRYCEPPVRIAAERLFEKSEAAE